MVGYSEISNICFRTYTTIRTKINTIWQKKIDAKKISDMTKSEQWQKKYGPLRKIVIKNELL